MPSWNWARGNSPRYKPGDNVRFLALALLLGLVAIGGTDGKVYTFGVSDDDLRGGEVYSARANAATAEADTYYELFVVREGSLDARLTPLGAHSIPLPAPVLPSPGRTPTSAAGELVDAGSVDGEVGGEPTAGAAETVSLTRTVAVFFQGYRAASGAYPEERIDAMIRCESTWRIDPGGYHLGLAQFDPGTWGIVSGVTGLTDPYNPYHQGFNVAVWASMISPGTAAGWPSCW